MAGWGGAALEGTLALCSVGHGESTLTPNSGSVEGDAKWGSQFRIAVVKAGHVGPNMPCSHFALAWKDFFFFLIF